MYLPKKWDVKKFDQALVDRIAGDLNINRITAGILVSRGMSSIEKAEDFMNPDLNSLYDPMLLPGIGKGIDRIRKAIEGREKILIYGDRDVDGITAVVIMMNTLKDLGADCRYFVPMEEAYGVQNEIIDRYKEEGVSLIITVDCGTKNVDEVAYASSLGIDTVITDHHEAEGDLPGAVTLINPKLKNSKYPFRDLAGCAVAFKVCQALSESYSTPDSPNSREFISKYMDLMALGSVADIVPLVNENRVLVRHGLEPLLQTKRLGLKLLIEHYMRQPGITELTAKDVSWRVVPPLNASGRMGNAALSCELMLTDTVAEAEEILEDIIALNNRRRSSQEKSLKTIKSIIHNQCNVMEEKVLLVASKDIDKRIAGVIASQVMQEYYKPVIVLRIEGNEVVGSARSIESFDISEGLHACSDLLLKYGGHKFAAGLSMSAGNIEEFRKRINAYADKKLTDGDLTPKVTIDQVVEAGQIDDLLMKEMDTMEPFGYFNTSPVFAMYGVSLGRNSAAGMNNSHLRIKLKDNDLEGFGWGLGILNKELQKVDRVDIAFNLERTVWDGRKYMRLLLKDIRPSYD